MMPSPLPPEVQQMDDEMEAATKGAIGSTTPEAMLPAAGLQEFGAAVNEVKAALSGGEVPATEFMVEGDGPMPPDLYAEAVAVEEGLKKLKSARRYKFSAQGAASDPGKLTEATALLQTIATDEDVLDDARPAEGMAKPEAPPMRKEAPPEKVDKYDGLV